MAKTFDSITPELRAFIEAQPLFFVATAPLSAGGHVNLSPKGYDTLRVLDANRVAYLDLTGSGNETSAHLLENGRVTFMFCAFDGAPKIVRLYGRGRTVLPGDEGWDELRALFPDFPGIRQVIIADVTWVQTSCGYAVPRMELVEERPTLIRWAEAHGEEALAQARQEKNAASIDGLPAPLASPGPHGRSLDRLQRTST
ncbi:MAG: pyridoxamine 5'-phosphate oxidase family protein [Gemmatimonadetes bacterium]|nr:pyridoxamine 5'-phosphate oxidase family protein [Gemmatimonadota bacterium]